MDSALRDVSCPLSGRLGSKDTASEHKKGGHVLRAFQFAASRVLRLHGTLYGMLRLHANSLRVTVFWLRTVRWVVCDSHLVTCSLCAHVLSPDFSLVIFGLNGDTRQQRSRCVDDEAGTKGFVLTPGGASHSDGAVEDAMWRFQGQFGTLKIAPVEWGCSRFGAPGGCQ